MAARKVLQSAEACSDAALPAFPIHSVTQDHRRDDLRASYSRELQTPSCFTFLAPSQQADPVIAQRTAEAPE